MIVNISLSLKKRRRIITVMGLVFAFDTLDTTGSDFFDICGEIVSSMKGILELK